MSGFADGLDSTEVNSTADSGEIFQSTILENLENLRPGSLSEPCFDVTENGTEDVFPHLGKKQPSFSGSSHHSSGSITQIRAASASVDVENLTARTAVVSLDTNAEFFSETVVKSHLQRGLSSEDIEILKVCLWGGSNAFSDA